MLKTAIKTENLDFLRFFENQQISKNVYIKEILKNDDVKDIAKEIQNYFSTTLNSQVIFILKIENLKNIGETQKDVLEDLKKIALFFTNKNLKVNILKIGTFLESPDNFINKSLEQIKNNKKVIYNSNETYEYLVSKKDLKRAIEKIIDTEKSGLVIDICLNKQLQEDLIRRLKEKYTFETFENKTNKINEKLVNINSQESINFRPEVTIKQYLEETLFEQKAKKELVITEDSENIKKTGSKKKSKLKTFANISKNIFIAGAVVLLMFTLEIVSDKYLLYTKILAKDTNGALFYAEKLRNINLPTKWGKNYTNLYNSVYYALNTLEIYDKALKQNYIDNETVNTLKEMSNKSLVFAKEVDVNYLITSKEKDIFNQYSFVFDTDEEITKYIELIKILDLLKDKQKTIILIQNSNELRSTGGFLGAYSHAETENGEITDYKFDDIYNIDGTLQEKYPDTLIKMPDKYKIFNRNEYIFARDTNLILDYKIRNETLLSYFETALEKDIDNIVYINTDIIKRILVITGPIKLATYNEEITSENVDTLAQKYAEQNYYEGSTQKKNFLNLLGAKAVEKLKDIDLTNPKIVSEILKALSQKEILVYSKNQDVQKILEKIQITNNIPEKNKAYDYFYFVEDNLGENKVNKLTNREVNYTLEYDQRRNLKLHNVQIKIENNSNTYSWPYGEYKGLMHIFIPINAEIAKISYQKNNQGNVNITSSITEEQFSNLKMVEVPFTIKPEENGIITLEYEQKVSGDKIQEYGIDFIKQPGNQIFNINFILRIPDFKDKNENIVLDKDKRIFY